MTLTVIKPNTTFELCGTHVLSAQDLQILTILYQPIVGPQAFSLFMTLNALSLKKNDTVLTHHLLVQVLHAKVEEIVAWRYKLEGVGLIQVFVDDNNEQLTYVLKKPLSQRKFFNDGIINVFLNLKVGNVDYQFIKQYFSEESEEGIGKNVSKPFNEVFDTTVLSRHSQIADVTPVMSSPSGGVQLEQAFNEELLLTLLTQFGLDDKVLSDKLMDQLNKIAFLYKLDEHELARLIFDAIDADGFVNMELFRKQAKQYFQFINKGKPVQMVEVPIHPSGDQVRALKVEEHVGSKDDKLMHYLTHTNPIDFLKQKSHQKDPVPADRQLVEWLLVDQQFPPGVVNVLVDYVLKVSDGRLPRALVEKIAGEWTRKDINSVDKAIKQVKLTLKAKDKREQTAKTTAAKPTYNTKRQPIRQEKVPDWLHQSTEQPNEQPTLTSDDLKKIEQMKKLQEQFLNRK